MHANQASMTQMMTQLYGREFGNLRRHVVRKLGSHFEAEDVVQEACIRMLTMPADHPTLKHPKAFLFTVTSNLAVDSIRREQRQRRLFPNLDDDSVAHNGETMEIVCPRRSAEDQIDASARLSRVVALLDELPESCRKAFVLHKFHELSYAEVAQKMGVTVSMVEKHLSRALLHLRGHKDLFDA